MKAVAYDKIDLRWQGLANKAALFLQEKQGKDAVIWAKFVDVFRTRTDGENNGWRGEYWGKMMRGSVLVYQYTKDEELYKVLTETVKDLLTVAEGDGRVSSFTRETEFRAWDLWCRKYVILGCEFYLEICKDEELKKEILSFLCRCADYVVDRIGEGEGKLSITKASGSWYGINSSSILEPIVRLYNLTKEQRYLDFATYIVEHGGAEGIDIFEKAYENKELPYQYGVSKAYEMISCFEGLLEYYYVTGIEKYKTAVINFGKAVLDSEISIIGCCGITHELFDHTVNRQTVNYEGVKQETCVTVTWMKFCSKLLGLTGDPAFADEMERSFYNAYLGSLNVEEKECPSTYEKYVVVNGFSHVVSTFLALDSYSPLIPGKRGQKTGGTQLLTDHSYYGCCACIGAAGLGVFAQNAVMTDGEGLIVHFFEEGTAALTYKGVQVELNFKTRYPANGALQITVKTDAPIAFKLKVRNPAWNGEGGYLVYERVWNEDILELNFDMSLQIHRPLTWDQDLIYTDLSVKTNGYYTGAPVHVSHQDSEDHYVAVTRGPLVLAADSRTGKPADSVFDFEPKGELVAPGIAPGVPSLLKLEFTDVKGEKFYLVDYASAGRDWDTVIAAWLPTK